MSNVVGGVLTLFGALIKEVDGEGNSPLDPVFARLLVFVVILLSIISSCVDFADVRDVHEAEPLEGGFLVLSLLLEELLNLFDVVSQLSIVQVLGGKLPYCLVKLVLYDVLTLLAFLTIAAHLGIAFDQGIVELLISLVERIES